MEKCSQYYIRNICSFYCNCAANKYMNESILKQYLIKDSTFDYIVYIIRRKKTLGCV